MVKIPKNIGNPYVIKLRARIDAFSSFSILLELGSTFKISTLQWLILTDFPENQTLISTPLGISKKSTYLCKPFRFQFSCCNLQSLCGAKLPPRVWPMWRVASNLPISHKMFWVIWKSYIFETIDLNSIIRVSYSWDTLMKSVAKTRMLVTFTPKMASKFCGLKKLVAKDT